MRKDTEGRDTGSAAPHWLYDVGVPEIKLEGNTEDSYPYYPDPIYKEYYYRLDVRYSLTDRLPPKPFF